MPLIGHHLLESIEFLSKSVLLFDEKCVSGIEANDKKLAEFVERNLMVVTELVPKLGYDEAARIADQAYREGKTIKEILKSKR